jgi:hypothetical protein
MHGGHHLGAFAHAAATRLVEPARTSPMANTPGTLVSSASGARPALAHGAPLPGCPVQMKPRASTATLQPCSQAALGSAPTNRNRCRSGPLHSSPLSR